MKLYGVDIKLKRLRFLCYKPLVEGFWEASEVSGILLPASAFLASLNNSYIGSSQTQRRKIVQYLVACSTWPTFSQKL